MILAVVSVVDFINQKKILVSLRLDNDLVLYFKKLASEQKVPYQILINTMLRKELLVELFPKNSQNYN